MQANKHEIEKFRDDLDKYKGELQDMKERVSDVEHKVDKMSDILNRTAEGVEEIGELRKDIAVQGTTISYIEKNSRLFNLSPSNLKIIFGLGIVVGAVLYNKPTEEGLIKALSESQKAIQSQK